MATARKTVAHAAERTHLDREDLDGLVLAVSEAVTNAHVHGRPPVTLRTWTAPDRVVVTIGDTGPGPADPFAGLAPADSDASAGGLGLWITHQICDQVAHIKTGGGFTIRLTIGTPQG